MLTRNIFYETEDNQHRMSFTLLFRVNKQLPAGVSYDGSNWYKKKKWVTSDGNIGTLGTSFGLNWIFLDTIQRNDFTWNFVGNSSNSWENEFYLGIFF
ncbi:hypothetical protein NQ315_011423 [Exocentrus adspersus]|uniref:Uncharacterized protein n=1 Tax=Exocentrus adspersus TaxID=1586481 RepID=A0AAV8V6C8_9CUCU|nr:hypothetical protein NQ315_011423 [Exocentrus adspersus]